MLNSIRSILITGGTGSFGKAFLTRILCETLFSLRTFVVFSRDEQWELRQQFPADKYPNLRLFLGDIRDRGRLIRALEGIDAVVHGSSEASASC